MKKWTKEDIDSIRSQIGTGTAGLRLVISYGRTGCVKARLWHGDGHVVAVANGGGYDKAGTVIANAVCLFFAPEVAKLAKRALRAKEGTHEGCNPKLRLGNGKFYGLHVWTNSKGVTTYEIDGACGTIDRLCEAMGLNYAKFSGGKDSDVVIISRKGK
jgi:hypothetical protein